MDWVDGSAGRLRVESTGSGPGAPVLLVHGGGADRSHWHAVVPLLATDRTVVSFDQRGYGESEQPRDGRRDLSDMATDVLAIASGTGLDRPILVGHSYGGAVTSEAVARFPDRFSGAVFLDPPGDLRKLSEKDLAEWRETVAPDRFRASSRAWFEQILHDAKPETRQHVLATLGWRTTPPSSAVFPAPSCWSRFVRSMDRWRCAPRSPSCPTSSSRTPVTGRTSMRPRRSRPSFAASSWTWTVAGPDPAHCLSL